jgi:hypothetical protein
MTQPRNPYLRLHEYSLNIPFLRPLAVRISNHYGYCWPSYIRRLFCFCWMLRVTLCLRSEQFGLVGVPWASRWLHGWSFSLITPFFLTTLYWKYSPPHEYARLVTALILMWKPTRWWNVLDGDVMFQQEWRRVWKRWQEAETYTDSPQGGLWRIKWLEEMKEQKDEIPLDKVHDSM